MDYTSDQENMKLIALAFSQEVDVMGLAKDGINCLFYIISADGEQFGEANSVHPGD